MKEKPVLVVCDTNASKQEEIDTLTNFVGYYVKAGSYLSMLFSPVLLADFAQNVRVDGNPDVMETINDLNHDVTEYKAEVGELTVRLGDANARIEKLTAEVEKLKTEKSDLVKHYVSEREQLSDCYRKSISEYVDDRKKIVALEYEVVILKSRLLDALDDYKRLEAGGVPPIDNGGE